MPNQVINDIEKAKEDFKENFDIYVKNILEDIKEKLSKENIQETIQIIDDYIKKPEKLKISDTAGKTFMEE